MNPMNIKTTDLAYEIARRGAAMLRDLEAINDRPRARKVYAYWQFKNGSIVELKDGRDLPTFDSGIKWDVCWDRSLGAEVVYPA